ncbi:PQQ-binding-like beta-propeller repeat protein [Streptomyces sp. SAS_276]
MVAQGRGLSALCPLVADGTLYVGTNEAVCGPWTPLQARNCGRQTPASPVYCTPAVSDGLLYFGFQNGRLPAVRG